MCQPTGTDCRSSQSTAPPCTRTRTPDHECDGHGSARGRGHTFHGDDGHGCDCHISAPGEDEESALATKVMAISALAISELATVMMAMGVLGLGEEVVTTMDA